MSKPFRPMLATDAELDKLRFPLLASPKLDGIRAVVRDGVVYSRSNKPIPNRHVQARFGLAKYEHHDGELIVGEPTSKTVYRDTVSGVMSEDGEPAVRFFTFDHVGSMADPYAMRARRLKSSSHAPVHLSRQVTALEDLLAYEVELLAAGYEGLILRDPAAPYKQGRSTLREGYLLKLKRFIDAEATVIGFEERMVNGNEARLDERGYTKRSSHKANKTGRGDLGALLVRGVDGIEFAIGTGFTDEERDQIWRHRDAYAGKLVKYKYFPVGVKEAPRHPVYLGWRESIDL